ncbi:trithorax group protein osa-like isoform X2 [Contarinia nasturtii]|uniref:trithorax group protein osa-like isoform X2 n=1 Tax=Contarinia nasturtii TaxID=265458 RepID=UPI0012D3BCC1|nr:trithorax group protein osa-like isoform X2 [Contarinia nasturtii]
MSVQKSTIVWSFVLIILTSSSIEAAKATRRDGTKSKSPNADHYALSYGGSHGHRNTPHQAVTHKPVQHQPVQQQHQAHQQHSPSAPAIPNNNNKPIGWNVPQHNTAEQSKTVSNTHSALPYPNNPPAYTPHAAHPPAGPPPPYSQNPNTGFQSNVPAGPPPPYSQNPNTGFHSVGPVGQPPAYQPNAAYPMHNTAGANYPQQQYNPGQGGYPGAPIPNNQPAPVINNFYGQPQTGVGGGGGSGGSFLQTLGGAAAGSLAGSLAGNALYGALKPDSEHKTVIIHENAASSNVPASAPAPAAPVGETTTAAVPVPVSGNQPTVQQPADPQTTMQQPPQTEVRSAVSSDTTMPLATNVPLAPQPETTNQASVPLAPLPESTNVAPTTTVAETSIVPNQTVSSSPANVPLAPFPPATDPSAHAQKGSATTFAIFNISVYTIISLIVYMF